MKSKRLIFILGILIVVSFASTKAYAAKWYSCTVEMAGTTGNSRVDIYLTDTAVSPAFTNLKCKARSERAKEMLAIGMAALASGLQVKAYLDPTQNLPEILHLRLMSQ